MRPNLKNELENLFPQTTSSPWEGYEFASGYGIFSLPLSSGFTLALRVFPTTDFAPYVTLWLQKPNKKWTLFYDAMHPNIACPRYFGAAVEWAQRVKIRLEWLSPNVLHIRMSNPKLQWTIQMREPLHLRILNAASRRLPIWARKMSPVLRISELIARLLRFGKVRLTAQMPSGHHGILMPKSIYYIARSKVIFDGTDLGYPVITKETPKVGELALPSRGIFAVNDTFWKILDEAEYKSTKVTIAQERISRKAA